MNNSISCIIIDDEQDAIDLLIARLKLLCLDIHILGTYLLWHDALKAIQFMPADIIFIDISMPGKNGVDLLKLAPGSTAEVIFITAHEEYALKAFEFSTSGYILKPIDDMELAQSVNRAIKRIREKQRTILPESNRIGIPDSKGITYLTLTDIEYLESVNGYTKVVTRSSTILTSFNLGKFKSVVSSRLFYQVHRSYIVNLNAVARYISTGEIVMNDNKKIPVAKSARQEFLHLFDMIKR